ncbi:hypothetical protein AURDEDRAFT_165651 [Auricularia subglabra TFB-10046 SS5]|nr:hypothetical protein AURDEDRAFT_165651 [Auricularia subglabra TFB-10046 SS5]
MASPLLDVVVEDDAYAQVSYFPDTVWTAVQDKPALYRSGSYHQTQVAGASATFSFTGSFVAYYSDHNNDHGNFTILLDGLPVARLNTFSPDLIKDQLIFSAFVKPADHTLTVSNIDEGKVIGVDYFV